MDGLISALNKPIILRIIISASEQANYFGNSLKGDGWIIREGCDQAGPGLKWGLLPDFPAVLQEQLSLYCAALVLQHVIKAAWLLLLSWMHSGTNMYYTWVPYVFKRQSSSKILPGGNESNWLNTLNHIFIREEIHPLVTLWKRSILTVITPTGRVYPVCKGNAVCSVTVALNGKAALTNDPFYNLMQLLCSYNSGFTTPMWEQNPSENKWDWLWSCGSHPVTSSLVAENGQGCAAHLCYFFAQASCWSLLNHTLVTADRNLQYVSRDQPWTPSEENATETSHHFHCLQLKPWGVLFPVTSNSN